MITKSDLDPTRSSISNTTHRKEQRSRRRTISRKLAPTFRYHPRARPAPESSFNRDSPPPHRFNSQSKLQNGPPTFPWIPFLHSASICHQISSSGSKLSPSHLHLSVTSPRSIATSNLATSELPTQHSLQDLVHSLSGPLPAHSPTSPPHQPPFSPTKPAKIDTRAQLRTPTISPQTFPNIPPQPRKPPHMSTPPPFARHRRNSSTVSIIIMNGDMDDPIPTRALKSAARSTGSTPSFHSDRSETPSASDDMDLHVIIAHHAGSTPNAVPPGYYAPLFTSAKGIALLHTYPNQTEHLDDILSVTDHRTWIQFCLYLQSQLQPNPTPSDIHDPKSLAQLSLSAQSKSQPHHTHSYIQQAAIDIFSKIMTLSPHTIFHAIVHYLHPDQAAEFAQLQAKFPLHPAFAPLDRQFGHLPTETLSRLFPDINCTQIAPHFGWFIYLLSLFTSDDSDSISPTTMPRADLHFLDFATPTSSAFRQYQPLSTPPPTAAHIFIHTSLFNTYDEFLHHNLPLIAPQSPPGLPKQRNSPQAAHQTPPHNHIDPNESNDSNHLNNPNDRPDRPDQSLSHFPFFNIPHPLLSALNSRYRFATLLANPTPEFSQYFVTCFLFGQTLFSSHPTHFYTTINYDNFIAQFPFDPKSHALLLRLAAGCYRTYLLSIDVHNLPAFDQDEAKRLMSATNPPLDDFAEIYQPVAPFTHPHLLNRPSTPGSTVLTRSQGPRARRLSDPNLHTNIRTLSSATTPTTPPTTTTIATTTIATTTTTPRLLAGGEEPTNTGFITPPLRPRPLPSQSPVIHKFHQPLPQFPPNPFPIVPTNYKSTSPTFSHIGFLFAFSYPHVVLEQDLPTFFSTNFNPSAFLLKVILYHPRLARSVFLPTFRNHPAPNPIDTFFSETFQSKLLLPQDSTQNRHLPSPEPKTVLSKLQRRSRGPLPMHLISTLFVARSHQLYQLGLPTLHQQLYHCMCTHSNPLTTEVAPRHSQDDLEPFLALLWFPLANALHDTSQLLHHILLCAHAGLLSLKPPLDQLTIASTPSSTPTPPSPTSALSFGTQPSTPSLSSCNEGPVRLPKVTPTQDHYQILLPLRTWSYAYLILLTGLQTFFPQSTRVAVDDALTTSQWSGLCPQSGSFTRFLFDPDLTVLHAPAVDLKYLPDPLKTCPEVKAVLIDDNFTLHAFTLHEELHQENSDVTSNTNNANNTRNAKNNNNTNNTNNNALPRTLHATIAGEPVADQDFAPGYHYPRPFGTADAFLRDKEQSHGRIKSVLLSTYYEVPQPYQAWMHSDENRFLMLSPHRYRLQKRLTQYHAQLLALETYLVQRTMQGVLLRAVQVGLFPQQEHMLQPHPKMDGHATSDCVLTTIAKPSSGDSPLIHPLPNVDIAMAHQQTKNNMNITPPSPSPTQPVYPLPLPPAVAHMPTQHRLLHVPANVNRLPQDHEISQWALEMLIVCSLDLTAPSPVPPPPPPSLSRSSPPRSAAIQPSTPLAQAPVPIASTINRQGSSTPNEHSPKESDLIQHALTHHAPLNTILLPLLSLNYAPVNSSPLNPSSDVSKPLNRFTHDRFLDWFLQTTITPLVQFYDQLATLPTTHISPPTGFSPQEFTFKRQGNSDTIQ